MMRVKASLAVAGVMVDLVSYIDNVITPPVLSCPEAQLTYETISSIMLGGGIDTNERESAFYSSSTASLDQLAFSPGVSAVPRLTDLVVLGAPIGSAAFTSAFLDRKISILEAKLSRLISFDQVQSSLIMSRFLLRSGLNHLLRWAPYSSAKLHVGRVGFATRRCLETLLDCPVSDTQLTQAALGVKVSGLGLACGPTALSPAFIASLAYLNQNYHVIFPIMSLGDASVYSQLAIAPGSADLHDLSAAVSDYFSARGFTDRPVTPASMLALIRRDPVKLQRSLAAKIDSHRQEVLLSGLSPVDRARIMSSSDPDGNGWLAALPTSRDLSISNMVMVESLRYRLGAPSRVVADLAGRRCRCARSTTIDDEGYHLRVCPLSTDAHVAMHNDIVAFIAWLARRCGFSAVVEPRLYNQGSRHRPDVRIMQYFNMRDAAFDFTFPSASCTSNYLIASQGTGCLTARAESMKADKYEWRCRPLSLHFSGAAMDSYGATGPGLRSVIDRLSSSSVAHFDGQCWATPNIRALAYQRISILVLTGGFNRLERGCRKLRSHLAAAPTPLAPPSRPSTAMSLPSSCMPLLPSIPPPSLHLVRDSSGPGPASATGPPGSAPAPALLSSAFPSDPRRSALVISGVLLDDAPGAGLSNASALCSGSADIRPPPPSGFLYPVPARASVPSMCRALKFAVA